nr:TolC family protein [Desulforhopalus vacuolatus]
MGVLLSAESSAQVLQDDQAVGSKEGLRLFTLEQCIERALSINPRILSAEDAVRSSGSEVGMARADFFPQVALYASNDRINNVWSGGLSDSNYVDQTGRTLSLEVTQTLFAGLTVVNAYQRSLLNREMVRAQKMQDEMQMVLDVQTTFFDRLKALEDVTRLTSSVHRLETNARAVHAFLDKEMIPYSNVLEVEAELANSRQQLSQAENSVARKTIELKMLIQVPDEIPVDFKGNLQDAEVRPCPSMKACLDMAFASRPEIQAGEKGVAIARKDRQIALGRFYPRVSMSMSYNDHNIDYADPGIAYETEYDKDGHDNYYKAQLTLQWDLFQGGKSCYKAQQARHEISRLTNNLKQIRDQVETQVKTSYFSLKEARERIRITQTFFDSALENYNRAQARLHRMVGTLLEVLVVEDKLRDAEASYVKAQADYRIARAHLDYSVGRRYPSPTP